MSIYPTSSRIKKSFFLLKTAYGMIKLLMIDLPGREYVGFPKDEVFRAGMHAETWPQVEGLILQPREEVVTLGSSLEIGLGSSALKTVILAEVVECDPSNLVVIEGASKLAWAQLIFRLKERGERGTDIEYVLEARAKGLAGKATDIALRKFLKAKVPVFTDGYRKNVVSYLEKESAVIQ